MPIGMDHIVDSLSFNN